jgi:hypothetical protein
MPIRLPHFPTVVWVIIIIIIIFGAYHFTLGKGRR